MRIPTTIAALPGLLSITWSGLGNNRNFRSVGDLSDGTHRKEGMKIRGWFMNPRGKDILFGVLDLYHYSFLKASLFRRPTIVSVTWTKVACKRTGTILSDAAVLSAEAYHTTKRSSLAIDCFDRAGFLLVSRFSSLVSLVARAMRMLPDLSLFFQAKS
jgi:hypothetical protein